MSLLMDIVAAKIVFLANHCLYECIEQSSRCNNMKSNIVLIIIGVSIAFTIPILMVSGGNVDKSNNSNQTNDDPIIQDIEYNQVKKSEQYAKVVEYSEDKVTIKGQITGSQSGKDLVVESVSRTDNQLNIKIETVQHKSKMGATVLTGYNYEITIKNVYENETIHLEHNGVNNDNYRMDVNGS